MATVADTVKESLLGATLPAELTQESRTTFLEYARQDQNGDYYMEEEDFINAIAPPDENYVSHPPHSGHGLHTWLTYFRSTKSSANSLASSSMWQIDGDKAKLECQSGLPSRTS
jgi:hypothetical protein